MAGTLFHGNHISLVKWFWANYFLGSDKGSISALRLSKLIEVYWRTARLILKKLRVAMGHRDSLYQLGGTIELDDALIGGRQKGKRGRGANGKTSVLHFRFPTALKVQTAVEDITDLKSIISYHTSRADV